MSIYNTMLVHQMSDVAKLKAGDVTNTNLKALGFDLRAVYPFYKLRFGQSLAFEIDKFNIKNIRSSVSQYNKRHSCKLVCIKHDNGYLEVARIG